MTLTNDQYYFDNPDGELIELILEEEESTAISKKDEMYTVIFTDALTFLQVIGNPALPNSLELFYQDGSLDKLFKRKNKVNIQDVIIAFKKYAAGKKEWKIDYNWEKVEEAK